MVVLKHFKTVLQVAIWRVLANLHIGDPLNKLVHVNKYRPYRKEKHEPR